MAFGLYPRPLGGFSARPEPYTIGNPERGEDLSQGIFDFSGFRIEAPERGIFDLPAQGDTFDESVHGFGWLDHLAAFGSVLAQQKAQSWTLSWVEKHGNSYSERVDLTGHRLLRLLLHAEFLTEGMDDAQFALLVTSMGEQAIHLRNNWKSAAPGLPRFEALTGLLFAGLCLEGLNGYIDPALKALDAEARAWIDDKGGIPTRNPEELLHIFCLLTWVEQALGEVHRAPGVEVDEAIFRMAPTLRGLRHADGGLVRFHGGGRGPDGWLDYGLAQSGVREVEFHSLSMGVARLAALRTTLMVDCAVPPPPKHAGLAHASALAFELTSGRRPIVVSCGSGASLGKEWQQLGRETEAHSTVVVGGLSSASFAVPQSGGNTRHPPLVGGPKKVAFDLFDSEVGRGVECWHDGYRADLGLVHSRQLALSRNGRVLAGQDTLAAVTKDDRTRLNAALDVTQGLPFALHFHLHPEVEVTQGADARTITLSLASGENWVFRHDGHRALEVAPSTYLERGELRPIPSKQLILKGRMLKDAVQVNWSLAKDDETPQGIRDLVYDEKSD